MLERLLLILALLLLSVSLLLPLRADAQLQNLATQILPSAARTAATVASADQTNSGWRGVHVVINVSAYTSGSYTPYIQSKDPVSGTYYNVLVGNAISATGVTVLKVYPGMATIANGAASDFLPRTWRVYFVGASSQSMTFSVGAFLQD